MAKSKKDKSQVEEKNVEVVEEEESTLYYFYSVGCGFCKKAEPIVDKFNKSGKYPEILKLDLAESDNKGLKDELSKKYNKQCGTPWFIDGKTGNQVCGFRDEQTVEKWLNGEDVPAPPRPKSQPPKLPFHGASEDEINDWKDSYEKWKVENEHLPNLQEADTILERPRPKSDPPRPPAPNSTDKQYDEWGEKYDKWAEDNKHLPNLQSSSQILPRLKGQNQPQTPNVSSKLDPNQEARLKRLEQKMDKLIKHLGVK
tara:strand:+ start:1189 stop:1956 length:768 start_codon:yes stop_codon:yes gene_type:complete